jgi:hypothetical protein
MRNFAWRRNDPVPKLFELENAGQGSRCEAGARHVDPVAAAVYRPVVGALLQFHRAFAVRLSALLLVPLAWVPISSLLIWLVYRRRVPDEAP